MNVMGFVPVTVVAAASLAAALIATAGDVDTTATNTAPWDGDRSDLPIGPPGGHPDLSYELRCSTNIESGTVDYDGTPAEESPPDEVAIRVAAYATHTDPAIAADWSYDWRDLTQSAGAMLVYDMDTYDPGAPVPRVIAYFELHEGSWMPSGVDNCALS